MAFLISRRAVAGAALAALLGAVSTQATAQAGRGTPQLPEETQKQIAAIVQEKKSRTPAQQKIDSQLLYTLKQARQDVLFTMVPKLKPSLDPQTVTQGRALVEINANVTPRLVAFIKASGGEVVSSLPAYHTVRAWIPITSLESVASLTEVKFIKPPAIPTTNTGSVNSQGDATLRADLTRSTFGLTGAGVKVGVLSDSVDNLASAQSSGDLGTVTVLPGQAGLGHTGEGTAMLEIVHDLAPSADLFFATAFNGEAQFAQNIRDLHFVYHCDIVVDDVSYSDESPFQDGVIAKAINDITADGALYFSSAANNGNLDSFYSGTWEGDYHASGLSPVASGGVAHAFGYSGATPVIHNRVSRCNQVTMFWSDAFGASANDYDLYVLDTSNNVVASSTNIQNGTQDPDEGVFQSFPDNYSVMVLLSSGQPRFLHVNAGANQYERFLDYSTQGATVGHNAGASTFSVAAVDANTSYPNPFPTTSVVEQFSSDGPRHIFYDASGAAITPGNFLSTGGSILLKPDMTSADGVSTSQSHFSPFYGTSAAAPHAAAVAALLRSYSPAIHTSDLHNILVASAKDIMSLGWDRDSGYGIFDAFSAVSWFSGTTLQSLSVAPGAIPSGGSATGTLTLSVPAPPSGLTVPLSSNSVSATVPASVVVPGGASHVTFTVSAGTVTSDTTATISASINAGTSVSGTVTVQGSSVSSLTASPASVQGGAPITLTVTLASAAPAGGKSVTVTSSDTKIGSTTITVAAGSTTGSANAATVPVAADETVTFTVTGSSGATATAQVKAPTPVKLALNFASVPSGVNVQGVVTLSGPAPTGGINVALSSDNAAASVPATVPVAAGQKTATFVVTTNSVTVSTGVNIGATYSGATSSAALTVTPAVQPTVQSLTLATPTITSNGTDVVTITLSSAALKGGAAVNITRSAAVLSTPSWVTVQPGHTTATFTIKGYQEPVGTSCTLTGAFNSSNATATVTFAAVALQKIVVQPNTVHGGQGSFAVLTLTGPAPAGGVVINLTSGNSSVAQVPATFTIPAGQTTGSAPITTSAVTASVHFNIIASYASKTFWNSIYVNP